MLLRVRSNEGTHRIEIEDKEPLYNLKKKLAAITGIAANDVHLSRDPTAKDLIRDDTRSLQFHKLKHGDLIHLVSSPSSRPQSAAKPAVATPPAAASSSSATPSAAPEPQTQKSNGSVSRCVHGPNATCIHCLPPSESKSDVKKCEHGPSVKCPNCPVESTGKKIPWLCTHGPGGKCPNCTKVKKTPPKIPCTHPPTMICPNCPPKETGDQPMAEGKPLGPPPAAKKRCLHGPRGMCENCMTKQPNEATAVPEKRKCRNHGPHGSCLECMAVEESKKQKMKLQTYTNTKAASVEYHAANAFLGYLQSISFRERRVGYLYGTVEEDATVKVEVIYEPPQRNTKEKFELLEDKDATKVEILAGLLGLKPIGWIFSHPRRDYSMSNDEVLKAASIQAQHGNQCVSLVLFENAEGQYAFEAFQLSDQCIEMYKAGVLLPSEDPKLTKTRDPVLVEATDTNVVDNSFFLVTLPIKDHRGPLTSDFPIENRKQPVQMSDLKIHMINNHKKKYVDRISNFHLLLFLSNYLDVASDMPPLCQAVRSKNMDQCEGFEIVINHLAGVE